MVTYQLYNLIVACLLGLCDTFNLAMASSPPPKPPRTMLDNQLSFKRLDTALEFWRALVQWTTVGFLGYMAYRSIVVLAGLSTSANIAVRLAGNLTVSRGIITLLTGSGWAFGLAQRSLRRKNIERLVPLKNDLEKEINPKRTTSNLTSRGTTPPKKGKR
jgi:hypothetical protein